MHHTCTEDLEPSRPLAHAASRSVACRTGDIDLGRRLREREEARAEAHLCVRIKELMQTQFERSLEIGKGDALVNDEPLHLCEHRGVRRIIGIAPIDTTGGNHANRRVRLVLLHRARLHGRGLRAQQDVLGDVERILHITRRVVLRQVQRLEVIVIALDLGSLLDGKAHLEENLLDAVQRNCERMQMSDDRRASRQGHVDLLGGNLIREFPVRQFLGLRCKQFLKLGARLVDDLADARTLLLCEGAHAAQESRHLPLFSKEFYTYIVEFAQALCRIRDRSAGAFLEFSDLLVHIVLLYVREMVVFLRFFFIVSIKISTFSLPYLPGKIHNLPSDFILQ